MFGLYALAASMNGLMLVALQGPQPAAPVAVFTLIGLLTLRAAYVYWVKARLPLHALGYCVFAVGLIARAAWIATGRPQAFSAAGALLGLSVLPMLALQGIERRYHREQVRAIMLRTDASFFDLLLFNHVAEPAPTLRRRPDLGA